MCSLKTLFSSAFVAVIFGDYIGSVLVGGSYADQQYQLAVDALAVGNLSKSLDHLMPLLEPGPTDDIEILQLVGSLSLKLGNISAGELFLERAVWLGNWSNTMHISNLIEAVRCGGNISKAIEIGEKGLSLHPASVDILLNLGTVHAGARNYSRAFVLFSTMVRIDSRLYEGWKRGASALLDEGRFAEAAQYLEASTRYFPLNDHLYHQWGIALHSDGFLLEALPLLMRAKELAPEKYSIYASIAALYQTLGRSKEAVYYYEQSLPHLPNDAGALNNYGALLGTMNRFEESLHWLLRSYAIDPTLSHTLINLASHYQDEGQTQLAYHYFNQVLGELDSPSLLELRMNLLFTPVAKSWLEMNEERNQIYNNLSYYIDSSASIVKVPLDATLDRVPFYISYAGLNDRTLVEQVVAAYHKSISNLVYVNPGASTQLTSPHALKSKQSSQRIRVGFISKFFGIFEPHGLLLDGVMRYLPRSHFEVFCFPVARNDGKPLAPSVRDAADIVIELPLSQRMVQEEIASQDLDVLVFADVMSEPLNHFLAHSRLARVQVAFWGNPITSGSKHMDFFVSADCMEHPYRNRIPETEEPYTEQVVLLEGQGIWYNRPESPSMQLQLANYTIVENYSLEEYNREYFQLESGWFIYLCPQSVFKMHPLFDEVFRDILAGNPLGHVVVTGGRRESWTQTYATRLRFVMGPLLFPRLHIIPRVSSEKFLGLLNIADVILHPFPFDGSRTSADGLIAGVPVITLPSEHLRGRMGAAFYRTMNIPELVAKNRSDYAHIAIKLSANSTFYSHMRQLILERSGLIWEDMSVPFNWMQFLARVSGVLSPSWERFLEGSERNVNHEMKLATLRENNRKSFDAKWGPEFWLLSDGIASLPSFLEPSQRPLIFSDWLNGTQKKLGPSNHLQNVPSETITMVEQEICFCDPTCLLEFGFRSYSQGEYISAFDFCSRALSTHHLEEASLKASAYSCVGVAGMYLKREVESIKNLYLSHATLSNALSEGNLVSGLRAFGRYEECVSVASILMQLPPLDRGGALIIAFSFVDWTQPSRTSQFVTLQEQLRAGGYINLDEKESLLDVIRTVQSRFGHLLNHVVECFSSWSPSDLWANTSQLLLQIVSADGERKERSTPRPSEAKAATLPEVALVTQIFKSTSNVTNEDMMMTLSRNVENLLIKSIHILTESLMDFSMYNYSGKIQQVVVGKRLTFRDAFELANRKLSQHLVILANADIYFDETITKVHEFFSTDNSSRGDTIFLSLLKWRHGNGVDLSLSLRTDSQDAWVFQPPVSPTILLKSDFALGLPRCDNRLAQVLFEEGVTNINAALAVHAIEIHNSHRVGNTYSTRGAVQGEGRNLLLLDFKG